MKLYINILLIFFPIMGFAQEIISQELFKGTIGNDLKIQFYLKIEEDGCPNIHASAIYKYDNNPNDNWILLNTTMNYDKGRYTFVEVQNTGILLLEKKGKSFNGTWISPDGSKQLPIKMEKQTTSSKQIEYLEDKLEEENYNQNDC
jgi:hypothetical protein